MGCGRGEWEGRTLNHGMKGGWTQGLESCPAPAGSASSAQRTDQGKRRGLWELKELELEETEG